MTKQKQLPIFMMLSITILLAYFVGLTIAARNTGFEVKTLWDWMDLLIVPSVLVIGAWWLNTSEKRVEREIADKRAVTERQLATERLQEESLQNYLDRMTSLIVDARLTVSLERSDLLSIARSRTLTVLRGLDRERRGMLIRFLHEAGLIDVDNVVISLRGADISGASLIRANLRSSDLSWSSLNAADLSYAHLHGADLTGCVLHKAQLSHGKFVETRLRLSTLTEADLDQAILSSADLQDADLSGATLTKAFLQDANLRAAKVTHAVLVGADMINSRCIRADFEEADLRLADLRSALFQGANLKQANLTGAILEGADLSLANLTGALIEESQLRGVKSLAAAVMPNGKVFVPN